MTESFEGEMARVALEAVAAFREPSADRLDLTPEILEAVEAVLREAAPYFGELSGGQVNGIVRLLGTYVLEVARREFGGKYSWYGPRSQPVLVVGEPKFHVALMAWDKVRGRLAGDQADNIPFFYAGFAERARQGVPGTRVLFV